MARDGNRAGLHRGARPRSGRDHRLPAGRAGDDARRPRRRDRARPPDRAPGPAHAHRARLRPLRRARLRPHPAGAGPRRRLRPVDRAVGRRPAAPGAARRSGRTSPARSPSSTVRTSSTSRGSRCPRSSRWRSRSGRGSRPLPTSLGKVQLAALAPGGAGTGAGRADAVRADPALATGRPRSATRSCARSGPAAGRSPTSSSPRASGRSPPRCATATAGSSPGSTSTATRPRRRWRPCSNTTCRCCCRPRATSAPTSPGSPPCRT
jgi:hypothetical protein